MPAPVTRVLLVEDNEAHARLVREALRVVDAEFPVDLECGVSLSEALTLLDGERFAAVLLVLSLSDSHGLEEVRIILEHAPGTPIVVLTGQDDETFAARALEAGANDYLVKGRFDGNLLGRTIRYAMDRQRIGEQLKLREFEAEQAVAVSHQRSEQLVIALQDKLEETVRREKAESRLRAKTTLLRLLQDVSAAASKALSPTESVRATIQLFCRYLGWPVARCLTFTGRDSGILDDIWYYERPSEFVAFRQFMDTTPIVVLAGKVLAVNEPAWTSNVGAEPALQNASLDLRVRSALAFPIDGEKGIVAVFEFFTDQITEPEEWLLAELPEIGAQLGQVIERQRAESALRDSEDRYRDLVEGSDDIICTHDLNGNILGANRAMIRTVAKDPEDNLIGRNLREFVTPDFRAQVSLYLSTIENQEQAYGLMKILNAEGQVRILEYRNTRRTQGTLHPIVRSIARDVTEKFTAERALTRSERRYRLLFERNLAGICRTTLAGVVLDCNDALGRLFGYENAAALMAERHLLMPLNVNWETLVGQLLVEGFLGVVEICLSRRDGTLIWVLMNLSALPAQAGVEPSLDAICIDISHNKADQEKSTPLANYDPVTHLPNRNLFRDRLAFALANGETDSATPGLALLFLDLDGFRAINDQFGHEVGDTVLRETATRLAAQVRTADTVARLGADRFAIMLLGAIPDDIIQEFAEKLVASVRQPFLVENRELELTASVGIAVAPRDGTNEETLIRSAGEAMYLIKAGGRNGYRFCDSEGLLAPG